MRLLIIDIEFLNSFNQSQDFSIHIEPTCFSKQISMFIFLYA